MNATSLWIAILNSNCMFTCHHSLKQFKKNLKNFCMLSCMSMSGDNTNTNESCFQESVFLLMTMKTSSEKHIAHNTNTRFKQSKNW
jgi:hypothetical protein